MVRRQLKLVSFLETWIYPNLLRMSSCSFIEAYVCINEMELKKLTGKKLKSFEYWQQISLKPSKTKSIFQKRGYFTDENIFSLNRQLSLDIELKSER